MKTINIKEQGQATFSPQQESHRTDAESKAGRVGLAAVKSTATEPANKHRTCCAFITGPLEALVNRVLRAILNVSDFFRGRDFYKVICEKDLKAVKRYIESGVDVTKLIWGGRCEEYRPPLWWATRETSDKSICCEIVQELLKAGADPLQNVHMRDKSTAFVHMLRIRPNQKKLSNPFYKKLMSAQLVSILETSFFLGRFETAKVMLESIPQDRFLEEEKGKSAVVLIEAFMTEYEKTHEDLSTQYQEFKAAFKQKCK